MFEQSLQASKSVGGARACLCQVRLDLTHLASGGTRSVPVLNVNWGTQLFDLLISATL